MERALQIAEGCIDVMGEDDYFRQKDIRAIREKLLPEVFLANIFYFRICSYTELIAMINHLDEWVSKHKDVRIISFHRLSNMLLFEGPFTASF